MLEVTEIYLEITFGTALKVRGLNSELWANQLREMSFDITSKMNAFFHRKIIAHFIKAFYFNISYGKPTLKSNA